MCEPVTIAATLSSITGASITAAGVTTAMSTMAMVAGIGGTVMTAMNASQQAKNQRAQLEAQGAASARDAALVDQEAHRAQERGDREQEKVGIQENDLRGRQLAGLGASGVDLAYGSAAGVQAQTDYYGMNDQLTVRQNTNDADYSLRNRAANLRSSGAFTEKQAGTINPWLSASGSLLTGAGQVADRWYTYSKK